MDSTLDEFHNYIRNIREPIIGIVNEGKNYEGLGPIVIDLMQWVERVHVTLSNDVTYQEELANSLVSELFGLNPKIITLPQVRSILNVSKDLITKEGISFFKSKVSRLSNVYEENPCISSQLANLSQHRSQLKKSLLPSCEELNRNYHITTIVRIFGYILEIICSLKLGVYFSGILIESPISPLLGISFQCLSVAAAYFRPICIMTSFAESVRSKYIVQGGINIIEDYRRNFLPVKKFISEKVAMQGIVTELFLQKIDEEVIKIVEKTFKHLTSSQKIFTAVLVSGMKKYPLCIQDGRFLHITYQFSKTAAAKEWYSRMSHYIDPVEQRKLIKVLDKGLLELKIISCVSSLPVQVLLFIFKPPILPQIVLFGLHSFCLLYEMKNLKCEKKCMLSKDLRKLVLPDAEMCLGIPP